MTRRAFAAREAAPPVRTAPCVGCGAMSESRLCVDCDDACALAALHVTECDCDDCAVYARANAAAEVSL